MTDSDLILAAITDYREAFNTADVERLISVFAPGYTDMSVGMPSFYGEEAPHVLRQRMSKLFANYRAEMRISVILVQVKGDTAFDYGWHDLTLTPKTGGPPVRTRQRYCEIWTRTSQGWKIRFFIDNADLPPAMPDIDFGVPQLATAIPT